jgi:hypothetical protein
MGASITLGRDGMGDDATEADFESYVAFVVDEIDEACGFPVEVTVRGPRDVQGNSYRGDTQDDVDAVRDACQLLWDRWLEAVAPAVVQDEEPTVTAEWSPDDAPEDGWGPAGWLDVSGEKKTIAVFYENGIPARVSIIASMDREDLTPFEIVLERLGYTAGDVGWEVGEARYEQVAFLSDVERVER